ncbi:NADH-quinone oxidoreductase subunit N, partial [bacterium]|nr:NADH-quinone oxidoreductase subunit N [bacterium]
LAYAIPSMAILFIVADEGDSLDDLAGLSARRPAATWGVVILLLSLVGIPPFGGFIGKLYLFGAGLDADLTWLTVVGVVASVLSAGYYFRIVRAMFAAPAEETAAAEPAARSIASAAALALAVLAVLAVGLGAGPLSRALGLIVRG